MPCAAAVFSLGSKFRGHAVKGSEKAVFGGFFFKLLVGGVAVVAEMVDTGDGRRKALDAVKQVVPQVFRKARGCLDAGQSRRAAVQMGQLQKIAGMPSAAAV